ncbi:MAG TPA: hypothetical protein VMT34_03430, partial [Aggregatilineales bacterium]|nr:hypothetical protein [Aggregatilineales bacterium]
MLRKTFLCLLTFILVIPAARASQAAPAPDLLIYVTDLGIFSSDSTGALPRTLVNWVSVVGRKTCSSVSVSPHGRYLAAVHPSTDLQAGYSLDILKLPDATIVRKALKQVVDPARKPDLVDMICHNTPAWSPDGVHIAFRAQFETARPALYDFNITALRSRRLATAQGGLAPGAIFWSPGGTWIVFSDRNPTGDESLYLVPYDASKDPLPIYTGSGTLDNLTWLGDNAFVSWHLQAPDCLTGFRYSEIPARSSRVLFGGCASAAVFDSVHRTWLLTVTSAANPRSITAPGVYLLTAGGNPTRIEALSGSPVRIEAGADRFIAHNAAGTFTVDPQSGEVDPFILPAGVSFPPDAEISVGKAQTVFSTRDGVWLVDPAGSAAPLINDPPGATPALVWSPDGTALLAIRQSGLWVYRQGTQARLLNPGAVTW